MKRIKEKYIAITVWLAVVLYAIIKTSICLIEWITK